MITEAIITAFSWVLASLVSLLPAWTAPDWLTTAVSALAGAMGDVHLYAAWFPLTAMGFAIAFLLACQAVSLAIRGSRIAISLFTGGGGSAA